MGCQHICRNKLSECRLSREKSWERENREKTVKPTPRHSRSLEEILRRISRVPPIDIFKHPETRSGVYRTVLARRVKKQVTSEEKRDTSKKYSVTYVTMCRLIESLNARKKSNKFWFILNYSSRDCDTDSVYVIISECILCTQTDPERFSSV